MIPAFSGFRARDAVVLVMGVLMLFAGMAARVEVPFRPTAAALTAPPLEDDSFYTQSYARAIARGRFFTLNGVHRSDAYFPAYTFACAAIHRFVSDPVSALRAVLAFNAILAFASSVAAGLLARAYLDRVDPPRRLSWSVFAAGAYACNMILFLSDMNAMETGLLLFLFLLATRKTVLIVRATSVRDRDFALLGVLFAALCLTRVDMALFTLFHGLGSLAAFGKKFTVRRFFISYAPAAAVTAAWLWIGYLGTGSFTPTGGAPFIDPVAASFKANVLRAGVMFGHFVIGLPYVTWYVPYGWIDFGLRHWALPAAALLCVTLAALLLSRSPERALLRPAASALVPTAAGLAGLVLPYLYFYIASFFYQRYFIPFAALAVVGWSCVLCVVAGSPSSGRAVRAFGAALWAAYMTLFAVHQTWISKAPYGSAWPAYEVARAVQRKGESVASFESGILGYYLPNVINLDGKTNADALSAVHGPPGAMPAYIVSQSPDYIVDRWGALMDDSWIVKGFVAKDPLFLRHYEFVSARPYLWRRRK